MAYSKSTWFGVPAMPLFTSRGAQTLDGWFHNRRPVRFPQSSLNAGSSFNFRDPPYNGYLAFREVERAPYLKALVVSSCSSIAKDNADCGTDLHTRAR